HPQLRPLLGDLGRPGPARVEALARIALTGLALGAAWAVAAPAVAWVIADFKRMNAAAVLATALVMAVGLGALVVTGALAAPLGRWLGRRAWLVAATRGRPGAVLLVVAGVAAGLTIHLAIRRITPEWDPEALYLKLVALGGIGLAFARRPDARAGGRALALAGVAWALVAVASLGR